MSDFKIGDTVRCIETWTTHVVESGREYTVDDVYPPQGTILVNDQWVPVGYFEKAERPFAAGEWVQVWAQIDGPGDSEKNTYVRLHSLTDRRIAGAWVRNDAIVPRTDGAAPAWLKEEALVEIERLKAALSRAEALL